MIIVNKSTTFVFKTLYFMNFRNKYYCSLIVGGVIFYLTTFYAAPSTPLQTIPYIDKWVHTVMFFGFTCALSLDYELRHGWKTISGQQAALFALLSGVYGGVIEVVQMLFFTSRSGEWLDWMADLTGCTIAFLFYVKCASPLFHYIGKRYFRQP